MKTTKDVERALRQELSTMSLKQLRKAVADIGVNQVARKSREQLIELAVNLELHAYTH
jgi:hypothetical protein